MEENGINLREKICWIYGYTSRNVLIVEEMKKNGFNIGGYIDKRAREYRINTQEKIFLADEVVFEKNNDILIILLLSVNSHLNVAKEMNTRGWNYILFMAAGDNFEIGYADKMRETYNRLVNMDFSSELFINKYTECKNTKNLILRHYQDKVTILMPIDLLFVDKEANIRNANSKIDISILNEILKFADKNIVRMKLYREFFDSILLGKGIGNNYLEIYTLLSGKEKEEYLQEREETLIIWEREHLNAGMRYFIDGAACVEYNYERKYFNITDGMHRLMFLLYKGNYELPVTMSFKDYEMFKSICSIRETPKDVRELYRRRLCFIRIWDKLDLLYQKNNIALKVIIIAANIYWALVMKQGGLEKVEYIDKNIDNKTISILEDYNISFSKESKSLETADIIIMEDFNLVQEYKHLLNKRGILFTFIKNEYIKNINKLEDYGIIYQDYKKTLLFYHLK